MATLGYTATPVSGVFSNQSGSTNQVLVGPFTTPAGWVTQIAVHYWLFNHTGHTAYLGVWGTGHTLIASKGVVSPASQQWVFGTFDTPFFMPAAQNWYIGLEVQPSDGYTVEYDTATGPSVMTGSATVPGNLGGNPVSTGFGNFGAYITYTPQSAPTISSVTPSVAPPGTSIVIAGTSFSSVTSLTIGGVAASYTIDSDIQITATVPSTVGGVVTLTVTNPLGSASQSITAGQIYYGTGSAVSAITAIWYGTGSGVAKIAGVWVPNGTGGVKRIW